MSCFAHHDSFNCIDQGPGGNGWMSLALDVDPFNSVTFAWFKKCPSPPSSWTGAAATS